MTRYERSLPFGEKTKPSRAFGLVANGFFPGKRKRSVRLVSKSDDVTVTSRTNRRFWRESCGEQQTQREREREREDGVKEGTS